MKTRKPWSLHEETKKEISEMYDDGLSMRNIAWYIGVSVPTIRNIVKSKRNQCVSCGNQYFVTKKGHDLRGNYCQKCA